MTEQKVISIIRENLEDQEKEITGNTELRDGLNIDSFATLMIMNDIEDEFGVEIEQETLAQGQIRVKDIVQYIQNESA